MLYTVLSILTSKFLWLLFQMFHSRGSPLPQAMYPIDQNSTQALPFVYQSTQQLSYPLQNGAPTGIENHFPANNMNGNGIGQNPNVRVGGFIDSMAQIQVHCKF